MSANQPIEVAGYFQADPALSSGVPVLPAKPEPLALDPALTAVIVVDLQNAYASKDGYLDKAGFDVSATGPVIESTLKVINTARAAGMPVVFFQNGWDKEYQEAGGPGSPNWYKSNALKTMRKHPELMGTLLAKGSWDYELVDQLIRYNSFLARVSASPASAACDSVVPAAQSPRGLVVAATVE